MKSRYQEAFLRHLGILTEQDQAKIKDTKIAIGGLGLGGSIFINLVRMGFEKFQVADPDIYERTNINRQRLAKESTVNKRKDESLLEEALDINPDLQVKVFSEGVKPCNVDAFLNNVDWGVDVIDVFALSDKLLFNKTARSKGVPVVSCGAIGLASAAIVFTKSSPSFEKLSGLDLKLSYQENIERFLAFIAPEIPHYMMEQMETAMGGNGHIPFVVSGVESAAAVCSGEIFKHIVNIGARPIAPQGIFNDLAKLETKIFEADWRARQSAPLKKAA